MRSYHCNLYESHKNLEWFYTKTTTQISLTLFSQKVRNKKWDQLQCIISEACARKMNDSPQFAYLSSK